VLWESLVWGAASCESVRESRMEISSTRCLSARMDNRGRKGVRFPFCVFAINCNQAQRLISHSFSVHYQQA
jgi:hypothetical protein